MIMKRNKNNKNKDLDLKLKEFLCEIGEDEIWIADGLSDAFLGVCNIGSTNVAVYSTAIIVLQLMDEGMTYEEAEEHLHFNIMGVDLGAKTPVYIDLIPSDYWKNN